METYQSHPLRTNDPSNHPERERRISKWDYHKQVTIQHTPSIRILIPSVSRRLSSRTQTYTTHTSIYTWHINNNRSLNHPRTYQSQSEQVYPSPQQDRSEDQDSPPVAIHTYHPNKNTPTSDRKTHIYTNNKFEQTVRTIINTWTYLRPKDIHKLNI